MKHSKIILCKKTNGTAIKQKDETWTAIANEYNSTGNIYRSVKQLKNKWEYMKKIARKEAGNVNRARRLTGGGPPPFPMSDTNEWVAGVLKESATGLDSQFDGDAMPSVDIESNVTVQVMDVQISDDVYDNLDPDYQETPVLTPKMRSRKDKALYPTPHDTRRSFIDLARKKKGLVELKTKRIENAAESTLLQLKEDKVRLEMELMRKNYENDERRKQELHELYMKKIKLEISVLENK